MTLLTDEELFGSFIPKPTISKITLKSAGVPPRRLNPHIDDFDTEGVRRTAGIVEGTQAQPTSTTIVSAVDGVNVSQKVSTDNLTIDLNLSVKDKIKDLQNSWFANISPMITDKPTPPDQKFDLKNYVKIYVFQSTSQNLSERILTNTSYRGIGQSGRSSDPQIDELHSIMGFIDSEQFQEKQLSDIDNPNDVMMETAKYTSGVEREDASGNPIYVSAGVGGPSSSKYLDVPYCVTFRHDQKYPEYLCYFVWAELDLSTLSEEFDFGVVGFSASDLFKDIKFTSQLSHYVALSAGKVPSTVVRYFIDDPKAFDDNGMPYSRKVQQLPDGRWQTTWPEGEEHMSQLYFLRRTIGKNILVQDFRAADQLNKLKLDFSIIQNALKGDLSLASKMRTANLSLDPPPKNFTDIMLTRDVEDNCRFIFSLDMGAIMSANSPYGNLFVNPLTKEKCIRQTKILSLSLHRVRIKGSPEIGSKPIYGPSGQAKRFNENNEFLSSFPSLAIHEEVLTAPSTTENDELLLKGSYGEDGTLSQTSFDGTTLGPAPTPFGLESFLPGGRLLGVPGSGIEDLTGKIYEGSTRKIGVKSFAGVDNTVKYKSDGYYQYRVVFELEDGAAKYLMQSLIDLRMAKKNLSEYYAEASKLGTSKLKNPFVNPHIRPPLQPTYTIEPGGVRPGNFNVSANRFTQEFNKFATTKEPTGHTDSRGNPTYTPPWYSSLTNPPWQSVASTYVRIMEELSGFDFTTTQPESSRALKRTEMQDTIKNYMSPETGNLEGVLKVFSLIETLENIISKAIGRTTSPPSGLSWKKRNKGESPQISLSGKAIEPMPTKKNTTLKSVRIDHTFKNIFNANLPKNTGINVFNYSSAPAAPLRKISRGDFGSLRLNELKKFFLSANPSNASLLIQAFYFPGGLSGQFPVNETSYTYFTPSTIKTSTTIINLTPDDNAEAGTNSTWPVADEWGRVGIADDMTNRTIGGLAITSQQARSRIRLAQKVASYMATNYNLTRINPADQPKPATAFDVAIGPGENPPPQFSDETLMPGNVQAYNKKNQDAFWANSAAYDVFSPISEALREGGKKDMGLYSDEPRGYLNRDGKNRAEVQKLPNPIKILFAYAHNFIPGAPKGSAGGEILTKNIQKIFTDGGFGGTDPVKMAMRYLFETIYVLEVFIGWEENRMVEVWQPLYESVYTESHKTFLCRFRKYENPKYGVTAEDSSQLPLYEQYFLLEPMGTAGGTIAAGVGAA